MTRIVMARLVLQQSLINLNSRNTRQHSAFTITTITCKLGEKMTFLDFYV